MYPATYGFIDPGNAVEVDHPLFAKGLPSAWLMQPLGMGAGSRLLDLMGRNHGTLTGMDPSGSATSGWQRGTRPGGVGVPLGFDGVNDYTISQPWNDPRTAFSWSVTFSPSETYSSSVGNAYRGLMAAYIGANDRDQLFYEKSSGSICWGIGSGGVFTFPYQVSYVTTFTTGTIYQIVVSRNGNSYGMYINGALVATGSNVATSTSGSRSTILGQDGAGSYAPATIYEAAIYPYPLSLASIAALYDSSLRGHPDLIRRVSTSKIFVPQTAANALFFAAI